MINIVVWSTNNVEIEREPYDLAVSQDETIKFLKDLLDKVHYSGETICLERAAIDINQGKAIFTEIERWK